MNRWRACWSSYQYVFRSQNKKNNSYQLWAEKVSEKFGNHPEWLNVLVNRCENKVTSCKLNKYDFTAAYLDTSLLFLLTGDANMNNSHGRKRMYPSSGFESYLFISWAKKDMIFTPTSDRGRKLTSLNFLTWSCVESLSIILWAVPWLRYMAHQ